MKCFTYTLEKLIKILAFINGYDVQTFLFNKTQYNHGTWYKFQIIKKKWCTGMF